MYIISVKQLAEKINNLERFTIDELQHEKTEKQEQEETDKLLHDE